MPRSRSLTALSAALGILLLAGCSASSVSLEPAADANDPLCAEVMVRLPSAVDGNDRRWTDAQSTAAWGDPTAVILSCGVPTPGPTEARCVTIGGVDWIVDQSDHPRYRITTYGRTPAVEVFVDSEIVSADAALARFAPYIVDTLPRDRQCTDAAAPLS